MYHFKPSKESKHLGKNTKEKLWLSLRFRSKSNSCLPGADEWMINTIQTSQLKLKLYKTIEVMRHLNFEAPSVQNSSSHKNGGKKIAVKLILL